MLKATRAFIRDNRLYTFMLLFVLLVQLYALLSGSPQDTAEIPSISNPQEFKLELEQKRQALQERMEADPGLAYNLGLVSMFILFSIITGAVLLSDYLTKKLKKRQEPIPVTLRSPGPSWGIDDVAKVVILFMFYASFFSVFSHIIDLICTERGLDRRAGMVASTGLMDILMLLFVLRMVIVKYRQPITALGLSMKELSKNVGIALYSYVGLLPLLSLVLFAAFILARIFDYNPPPEPVYELIFQEERRPLLFLISLLIAVIGPVIEEIFFRGFLYAAIRKRYGITRAILLSSLLFSALHTNLIGFLPILTLGIFLAYIREKTGSLMPSITVHMFHNSMLACLMFVMRRVTSIQ